MKRTALSVLACLVCSAALFAQAKIGTVKAFSGDVTIDAFGKGSFIKVIEGDALYGSTVLKAGPDGRAVLDLQGVEKEVPPGAVVKISDLQSASAKKRGLAWFAAVGRLIKSFSEASGAGEQDLVMGSRAGDAAPGDRGSSMEWEGDTDAASILPQARKTIDAGDFDGALQMLGKAEMPPDPVRAFELLYLKGFCYFQLEDYPDATACFSDAYTRLGSSRDAVTPEQRSFLLFQLGTSYFFLGREKEAVPVLAQYLAENADAPLAPYATLLLARSLAASGDQGRARALAGAAAKKYKGSELESEFASLQK